MVTKSKAATTLEEAPEAAPAADAAEEAPAAAEEAPAEAENAEEDAPAEKKTKKAKKAEKKKEAAEGDKEEGAEGGEKKKKPKKKVVPSWATLTDDARSKLAKGGSLAKPKVQDAIVDAIKMCGDGKGVASASAIRTMIMSENPDLPKMVLKKAMAKAVERGVVIQVKGKGLAGSFKLGKGKAVAGAEKKADKAGGKAKKGPKKDSLPKKPLEELFPHVFTWACNPKEASVGLIKKYLVANYPDLELGEDMKHYKKALELSEKNGTLERLTGKGFSGTFQLVDGANKTGHKFEDAFENACIAMNEPKDLSVSKIRDYLGHYHPEYKTDDRPKVLKSALDRAAAKGWVQQISGKGFSGTYRLMHPYYPGPRELWGKDYMEPKEKGEAAPKKEKKEEASPKKKAAKKRAADSDSEDEEDEDVEEEAYKPKATKRGAPKPRSSAAPAKKKAKAAVVAKKSKPAKGVKGGLKQPKGRGGKK